MSPFTSPLNTTELPVILRGNMQSLIDAFPCLKNKGCTWRGDSTHFEAQISGMSSGERDAACFILSVWNLHVERPKRLRFNLVKAMSNWDEGNRAAFLAWSMDPWTA